MSARWSGHRSLLVCEKFQKQPRDRSAFHDGVIPQAAGIVIGEKLVSNEPADWSPPRGGLCPRALSSAPRGYLLALNAWAKSWFRAGNLGQRAPFSGHEILVRPIRRPPVDTG